VTEPTLSAHCSFPAKGALGSSKDGF
jgi:hypothetical protein